MHLNLYALPKTIKIDDFGPQGEKPDKIQKGV